MKLWMLWKAWLLVVALLAGMTGLWVRAERATPVRTGLTSTQALPPEAAIEHAAGRSSTFHPRAAHLVTPVANARAALALPSNTGAFHFERHVVTPVSYDWTPAQVVVGDVTGDRLNDVVLTMNYRGNAGSMGWIRVRIHAQNPDGSLAAPLEFDIRSAVNHGSSLELVDLDRSGVPEIAVGNEKGLTIFAARDGHFSQTFYPGLVRASYLAAIDANGDGHMDVFAQSWGEGADIYLGDGRGGIRAVNHVATSPAGYNTVEVTDFTGDGLADLIMTNGQGWPLLWVYPYLPSVGLQAPQQFDLRPVQLTPPSGMTVADVDLDGGLDMVLADRANDIQPHGIRIFYRGDGNNFSRKVHLPTQHAPGATAVADIDGNGYPDIVTMFDSYNRLAYFLQGAAGFAPVVIHLTGDSVWTNNFYNDNSIAIADVNSDGCPDVVLAEVSSSLRVFYGRNCHVAYTQTSGPCLTQLPVEMGSENRLNHAYADIPMRANPPLPPSPRE